MDYVITGSYVSTKYGTKISHNGTEADQDRALKEARALDAKRVSAANARAMNDGTVKGRALTPGEVVSGSHARASYPIGVQIAVEGAEREIRDGKFSLVAMHLDSAIANAESKLTRNGYHDPSGRISEEIRLAKELKEQYGERARFLAESRPAPQSEAPTPPAWIDTYRREIESDSNLTPSQKRARLAGADRIEAEKQAEIDADQSRKAIFDRSDYTGALADAMLSQTLAELAHDLPEEFVIGARQRLERLKETGDDVTYRAETAVAESRQADFRGTKKAEREALAKAERESTAAPEPLPSPGA